MRSSAPGSGSSTSRDVATLTATPPLTSGHPSRSLRSVGLDCLRAGAPLEVGLARVRRLPANRGENGLFRVDSENSCTRLVPAAANAFPIQATKNAILQVFRE